MKIENKSDSKIITLGRVSILPGEVGELPKEFENNPLLKILPVKVIAESASGAESDGEDIPALIAKLKNSPEAYVRKLCEKYGVAVPDGISLPDLKKLLADTLTKAGDGDGTGGSEA